MLCQMPCKRLLAATGNPFLDSLHRTRRALPEVREATREAPGASQAAIADRATLAPEVKATESFMIRADPTTTRAKVSETARDPRSRRRLRGSRRVTRSKPAGGHPARPARYLPGEPR